MDETISYNQFLDYSPDEIIWKPISLEEVPVFKALINDAKVAFKTGTKKEKGDTLEKLMTFIYRRFKNCQVYPNVTEGDNQFDHILEFKDGRVPTFISEYASLRIIGESKNHNKTIGVREVADLNELLRSKSSKLGIFSSFKTFSKGKNLWIYSEGKRRKLALATNRRIIGFTITEIESLLENNFYTLLKQKVRNLIDELDDNYTDECIKLPYQDRLYLSLKQLNTLGIINNDVLESGILTIEKKYGSIITKN